MTRQVWKWYYRQLRIVRRESNKAAIDMLLYGRGAVEIGEHLPDLVRHVSLEELAA